GRCRRSCDPSTPADLFVGRSPRGSASGGAGADDLGSVVAVELTQLRHMSGVELGDIGDLQQAHRPLHLLAEALDRAVDAFPARPVSTIMRSFDTGRSVRRTLAAGLSLGRGGSR